MVKANLLYMPLIQIRVFFGNSAANSSHKKVRWWRIKSFYGDWNGDPLKHLELLSASSNLVRPFCGFYTPANFIINGHSLSQKIFQRIIMFAQLSLMVFKKSHFVQTCSHQSIENRNDTRWRIKFITCFYTIFILLQEAHLAMDFEV